MSAGRFSEGHSHTFMGQADLPPSVLYAKTGMELWPYRRRTVALLRRYAQASVEVGRIPALLGRELFRTRVTSYTMRNFEDVVIFVADMEKALEGLGSLEQQLLAMNILEEYTLPEVSRLLGCNQRAVERSLQNALDQLSEILLEGGLLEEVGKSCQEGKNYKSRINGSKERENKVRKSVGTPPSDLIS
jgi:hypothetical protein